MVPYRRSGVSRPGITVIRSRSFAERVNERDWPPRTSAEHTIFDLAQSHGPDRVIALMARGCRLRITSEEALVRALESRRGHPHAALISEVLGLIGEVPRAQRRCVTSAMSRRRTVCRREFRRSRQKDRADGT